MNFFWVLSGQKIKRIAVLVVAVFFAAGIFYAEKKNIQVFLPVETGPEAIYSVETDKKAVGAHL